MRRRPRIGHVSVLVLALGSATLILAGAEWLRVASAALLVAGIVLGVFAIAAPAALAEGPAPEELEDPPAADHTGP